VGGGVVVWVVDVVGVGGGGLWGWGRVRGFLGGGMVVVGGEGTGGCWVGVVGGCWGWSGGGGWWAGRRGVGGAFGVGGGGGRVGGVRVCFVLWGLVGGGVGGLE